MIRFFVLGALCILLGCNSERPGDTEKISARLDSLVSEISKKEALEKLFEDIEETAFLKPSNEGFSTIKTRLGTITVSIENVSSYANGSKVTLSVGNITSASINRLKMKVDWGKTDEKGYVVHESERTKNFTAQNPVRPGYWNNIQVILEDIPPTELGYVRISEVEYGGINLNTGW